MIQWRNENGVLFIKFEDPDEAIFKRIPQGKLTVSTDHFGGNTTVSFEQKAAKEEERMRLVDQVSETTRGRRDNYGRPLINFLRIAVLWTAYARANNAPIVFTPLDVAEMMVQLKIARLAHSYTDDSVLDIMGYADCIDDMNQQAIELGYKSIAELCKEDNDTFQNLIFRLSRATLG